MNNTEYESIYKPVPLSTGELKSCLKQFVIPEPNVLYFGKDPEIARSLRSTNAYARLYQVCSKNDFKQSGPIPIHRVSPMNVLCFPFPLSVANIVASDESDNLLMAPMVAKVIRSSFEHGGIFAFFGSFEFVKKMFCITDDLQVRHVFSNGEKYLAVGIHDKKPQVALTGAV
jgi:hypothetical protein